jgi:hypothetical protein
MLWGIESVKTILLILLYAMSQDYSVKKAKILLDEIRQKNGVMLYQDKFNRSFIYQLPDCQIILIPAIGVKGIIFRNLESMKEHTKFGIPIEEEHPNPFQQNVDKLSNIEEHVPYYLEYLSKELGIELDLSNESPTYFALLSDNINKYGLQKSFKHLFIPLGIFVGEKLRKKNIGDWGLVKKYGYNPYFEPIIKQGTSVFHPWYGLAKMLLYKRYFNFVEYYEFASMER